MTDVRVLIVDDQEPFREAMRMVVDITDGFDCVGEAADGIEAVEMSARLTPDLVLMDIQMPIKDGLVATGEIRDGSPSTNVVLLSTHESGYSESSAISAGAAAFIPKSSFSMEVLATTWERFASGDGSSAGS